MTRGRASGSVESHLLAGLRREALSKATYASLEQLAGELTATPEVVGQPEALCKKSVVKRLIHHAHRLIVRDPAKALVVAFVAQKIAARVPSPTVAEAADVSLLEGNAWYEYAAALLRNGRYPEAREAVVRAKAFFSLPIVMPKVRDEEARLDLIHGQILHFLGRSEEGLRMIESAGEFLLVVCDDQKTYVKARTIYATVLMRLERFEEALDVFDAMADMAEAEEDYETLAHTIVNIGFCAAKMGDEPRSAECAALAVTMFEDLGMRGELPRARGALVEVLRRHGKIAQAISEMYKVRNDYLSLDMPLVAARFSIEIATLLIQTERFSEAAYLCESLVETFTRTGLVKEARKALTYVKRCAAEQRLTEDVLAGVRRFLDVLSTDETATFMPHAS
jgi:tetratricopeptide (TPR) repeat protein